ncbi:methyltransferase domain-containing protein, partial [Candidatus Parcubacteria bacterium]|nr:methyltransferase domain-containing protein [Candidatus Parcubacteria bacterium]
MQKTQQEQAWSGEHGNNYNVRNPYFSSDLDRLYLENYGVTRKALNEEFLADVPKAAKILEVGCNVGSQLHALQEMGFESLVGVDINRQALEVSKKNLLGIDVMLASAFELPFKDNYFDLVFTSGVLIHISPKDIQKALKEIIRVSKKYILGFEYFNEQHIEVLYRGKNNLLWKGDFAKLYLKEIPNLKLVKEKRIKYLTNENIDTMFFLE